MREPAWPVLGQAIIWVCGYGAVRDLDPDSDILFTAVHYLWQTGVISIIGDLIKGILLFAALVLWYRWLYRPQPNAVWVYNDWIKTVMVFGVPFMLYVVGMAYFVQFFEHVGIGVLFERYENLMLFGVAVPLILIALGLALAYFLPLLGVPLPRFMLPRWIWEIQQEQREFDREQRRIKKERRRLKREQCRLSRADRGK